MADQLDFFDAPTPAASALPEGFKYQRDLITLEVERALLAHIRELPFKEFEFHGYVGKRRTVSFGAAYDFSTERLAPAESMPSFLLELRVTAAAFAGLSPGNLQQVLVTEYGDNAGIGWHRDKSVFGQVIGISLLSACQFRLRRKHEGKWQRATIAAEPRSAYVLSGPSRTEWEHSIPAVDAPRYSVTFREIR
jgi:alkylated DNA repair dioxygenase AlkB